MKKEYIIQTKNHWGVMFYVFGGTYKFGNKKYARLTSSIIEAKHYPSKGSAVSAGNRLAKTCENIKNIQIIDVEKTQSDSLGDTKLL